MERDNWCAGFQYTSERAGSTASGEIIYSSGTSETGIGVKAKVGRSSATRLNDSLTNSARSASFNIVSFTVILVIGGMFDNPDNILILFHHFLESVLCVWLILSA